MGARSAIRVGLNAQNVVYLVIVSTISSTMSNQARPIGIDLFAGAGGLSLGFEQAGFDIVAAVEVDPVHCAVHEFNFPNCETICASVSDLAGEDIRERAQIDDQDIDVVFGGAPCQGFSLIGKRAIEDPRNSLVKDFARLVLELHPKYFVFENVKGLTVGKHRKFLEELIEEFSRGGYDVLLPYKVLNAADYGVPQDRRRLFLVGGRRGAELPRYPEQKSWPRGYELTLERESLPVGPSVWDAIGDLPEIERYEELLERDWVRAEFGEPTMYARRLRGLTNQIDDYSYPRRWDGSVLTSSLRTTHTDLSARRFAQTEWGNTEQVSRFRKLHPDGLCNTLRAGTGSDRGAFTSPRPIHPYIARCITVREAARLHSYPDWFRFHATKWHGFRQIGNSVPPLLSRAVGTEIIRILRVEPFRPTKWIELGADSLVTENMSRAAERYEVRADVVGRRLRVAVNG